MADPAAGTSSDPALGAASPTMFDSLAQRMQSAFQRLGRRGQLTEADVDEALRMIRTALLGADVHLSVVRQLIKDIRAKAVGEKLLESVQPGQQVILLK